MGMIFNLKEYDKELYSTERGEKKLLIEGDYWGRHFAIVRNPIGFPVAYIEVKPKDWIMSVEIDGEDYDTRYDAASMFVNGGATYFGSAYWNEEDDRTYIGWDYAHAGDYYPLYNNGNDDGHKWTICEILMDVAHAVEGMDRDNDLNRQPGFRGT